MPILNMIYWATWWGGGWWQPWANTIAYYPLATDVDDASGNNLNLTNHWITFSDWYAILETTNQTSTQWPYASYSGWITWYKTISCWFYKTGTTNWMLCIWHDDGSLTNAYFQLRTQNPNWFSLSTSGGGTFNGDITNNSYTINFNQRHLVTITQDVAQNSWAGSGNLTVYLDGNLYGTVNRYMNRPLCWFGSATEWWYYYNFPWKSSNLIIEDKERTAQEVADYYNQTKWDYWL